MQKLSPSQPLLFLSDVHLGGFSKQRNSALEQELLRLVDYCQQNRIQIIVLGDLFDYWMEYPNHIPELGRNLVNRFEQYNRDLGPTLYITGNHDNWTRNHFKNIGFIVESEYRFIQVGNQQILLLHGDGLLDENDDLQRPRMHQLLRNDRFIEYYQKLLPPKAGLWVMKWFSRINRFVGPLREDVTKLNNWAEQTLQKRNIDTIICGHDHFPRKRDFHFGTFVNLGTFYKHRTIALYNNNSLDLVYWSDETGQLTNFYTA